MNKKLSDLAEFPGRDPAIELMARGKDVTGGVFSDANSVLLLGLIDYLVEQGIIPSDNKDDEINYELFEKAMHKD